MARLTQAVLRNIKKVKINNWISVGTSAGRRSRTTR